MIYLGNRSAVNKLSFRVPGTFWSWPFLRYPGTLYSYIFGHGSTNIYGIYLQEMAECFIFIAIWERPKNIYELSWSNGFTICMQFIDGEIFFTGAFSLNMLAWQLKASCALVFFIKYISGGGYISSVYLLKGKINHSK